MKNQFLTLALAILVITGTAITSSASVEPSARAFDCKSHMNLEEGRSRITAYFASQQQQNNQRHSEAQQLASAKSPLTNR